MLDPLDLHGMKRMFACANDPGDLRRATADPFMERSHWPRLIRQGYEAGTRALDRFRDPAGPS